MKWETRLGVALLAAMFAGTTFASQARAQTQESATADPADSALAARVEALLSAGIEESGAEAAIAALGEPGERALRTVFERAEASPYVRLRALSAMQRFPTEATIRYLEALVRAAQASPPEATWGELHPARSSLVLRRALEGLLALRARVEPTVVAPCLDHPDAHVRRVAADLLATLEGGQVDQALTKQLLRERSTMVRGRLQKALIGRSARPAALR